MSRVLLPSFPRFPPVKFALAPTFTEKAPCILGANWVKLSDSTLIPQALAVCHRSVRRAARTQRGIECLGHDHPTSMTHMKTKDIKFGARLLLATFLAQLPAWAQNAVITYQGHLQFSNAPANGTHDFVFRLCSSSGPAGVLQTFPPAGTILVNVTNGLFAQEVTFDMVHFTGAARWLEIEVNGTNLAPRQRLTATPYAVTALNSGHALDAADGSPPDALFIDNAGNVGIGTTTPARTLEVRAIEATLRLTTTTIVNGSRLELRNDAASPAILGGLFFLNSAGQTRGQISYRATDDFTFSTAATERMRIDAQGDLGIGLSNPLARLHVNGDIRCDSGHILARSPAGLGAADLLLDSSQDAGGASWFLVSHAGNTPFGGTPGGFSIYNGEHALSINSTGRVGIGTITPDARLHVFSGSAGNVTAHGSSTLVAEGAGHTYLSILSPDANERGILFGEPRSNVAGGIVYNNANTPDGFQFRTSNNVTRMVLTSAGDVGIGTTTPTEKLTVNGDFRVTAPAGDNSAVLPQDSVSATEMLNEPGLASRRTSTLVSLSGAVQSLASRSITTPTAGHVVVIGTVGLQGELSDAQVAVAVSDTATFPATQNNVADVRANRASTVTVQGVFPVAANTPTNFLLLVQETSGAAQGGNCHLTLLFMPTTYGTVEAD